MPRACLLASSSILICLSPVLSPVIRGQAVVALSPNKVRRRHNNQHGYVFCNMFWLHDRPTFPVSCSRRRASRKTSLSHLPEGYSAVGQLPPRQLHYILLSSYSRVAVITSLFHESFGSTIYRICNIASSIRFYQTKFGSSLQDGADLVLHARYQSQGVHLLCRIMGEMTNYLRSSSPMG